MADAETPAGHEDRVARLRLIRTRGIGAITHAQLLARFGTAARALEAVPQLARRGGGEAPPLAERAVAEREIADVARLGARHIFRGEADYPPLLDAIDSAPPALIVRGDPALAARRAVAMVGARNASAAGIRLARMIAAQVAEAGVVVVSGLARGIDTAAHMGAIGYGSVGGGTIAVIAGGIDVVWPPENADLQEDVATRGLLVAEQPPGLEPRARHFPYRNRIIAGLAAGTLVVEAAPKSGSLITARYAADFGREVMALPGSPLDPRAQGCNLLIREGATLVQSAADVIEALGPIVGLLAAPTPPRFVPPPAADASDAERRTVTALLGPVPVPADEIVRLTGLAPPIVQTVLLELELGGRLDRHAGGRVSLI